MGAKKVLFAGVGITARANPVAAAVVGVVVGSCIDIGYELIVNKSISWGQVGGILIENTCSTVGSMAGGIYSMIYY